MILDENCILNICLISTHIIIVNDSHEQATHYKINSQSVQYVNCCGYSDMVVFVWTYRMAVTRITYKYLFHFIFQIWKYKS